MLPRFIISTLLLALIALTACSGGMRPMTPLDTLKSYHLAVKKKDAAKMKEYLSAASVKMAEEEAKAQNIPVDEILLRESLFTEGQRTVEFRNETVEGDKALIYVKNQFGSWDTVPFVKENGYWKIDKAGFADALEKQILEDQKKLDDEINKGRQETEPSPVETITPATTPDNDSGLPEGMKPKA